MDKAQGPEAARLAGRNLSAGRARLCRVVSVLIFASSAAVFAYCFRQMMFFFNGHGLTSPEALPWELASALMAVTMSGAVLWFGSMTSWMRSLRNARYWAGMARSLSSITDPAKGAKTLKDSLDPLISDMKGLVEQNGRINEEISAGREHSTVQVMAQNETLRRRMDSLSATLNDISHRLDETGREQERINELTRRMVTGDGAYPPPPARPRVVSAGGVMDDAMADDLLSVDDTFEPAPQGRHGGKRSAADGEPGQLALFDGIGDDMDAPAAQETEPEKGETAPQQAPQEDAAPDARQEDGSAREADVAGDDGYDDGINDIGGDAYGDETTSGGTGDDSSVDFM